MSYFKIHPILSFLLFFTLSILPFTSSANVNPLSKLSTGDDVVGHINITTPGGNPYRVYEVDINAMLGSVSNPCSAGIPYKKSLMFDPKTTRIDLKTHSYNVTRTALKKMFGDIIVNCLQVVTYHGTKESGEIDSNKVKIYPTTMKSSVAATAPFNINLDLH